MKNLIASLTLLLPLGACDLECVEEEVIWRHDAQEDTLDVLLVYHGVMQGYNLSAEDDEQMAKALGALDRVTGGAREFMVMDWPFYWDLEDWGPDEEILPALAAFRRDLSVADVGLFLDAQRRLSVFQHLHLERASVHLASANRAIREDILEQGAEDLWSSCAGGGEALCAWAESGGDFILMRGNSVTVQWPSSAACTREFLAEFAEELAVEQEEGVDSTLVVVLAILAATTSLSLDENHMQISVGEEEAGELELDCVLWERVYDPALLGRLRERGEKIDGWPDLKQVRSAFDAHTQEDD